MRLPQKSIGKSSIKEAFDNLPIGLCYFNHDGLPVLCNHTMDKIAFELMGHDIQYETELYNAFESLANHIFHSSDGTIWRCTKTDSLIDGEFSEYISTNITELFWNTEELKTRNQELSEIVARMEKINKNIIAIAREEEILSMKMRIHSETGKSVLNIHQYYQHHCPFEQKEPLSHQLKSMIDVLQGQVGQTDEFNMMNEVLQTAKDIGAEVLIEGNLPNDTVAQSLIAISIRESLMNTLCHANGNRLFVKIVKDRDILCVRITNNGNPPATIITEGGGLSSLRKKIEKSGGKMQIMSLPRFILCIFIPYKGEKENDKCFNC